MPSKPRYEVVTCKTIDGITLEGWFYPAEGPAPAIVMTHGFNCVKEMSLSDTAEGFQRRGYNVYLYDSRSVGASGGHPRNQIDPLQMAEDVSDVVTHVMSLPGVDPARVFLWGMSLGGTVSAVAAIVDRRVAGVLMVCPIFNFVRPDRRTRAFAQLMRDRVSQLRGNEPYTLQPFNSKGENPIGMAGAGGPGGREAYVLMRTAAERGHPSFRDRITLQTYHKLALFQPLPLMDLLEEVPVMMMVPELDDMSPAADQRMAFERLRVPKRMHFAKGRGHMTILTGEGTEDIFEAMVGFFDDVSASRFVSDS
ncbi:Alpha/Beta hydrolase protein [Achaetomium macrosporum]|uniref:Alpha/Beta hydrolase protein n=1 Tax=Achaetomium macrosporum TaxID=79813 RepID=A0AAN7CFX0_9PEZI|nr:Alpha/Beta hydrolase protein [Achaetomium macrosporum]